MGWEDEYTYDNTTAQTEGYDNNTEYKNQAPTTNQTQNTNTTAANKKTNKKNNKKEAKPAEPKKEKVKKVTKPLKVEEVIDVAKLRADKKNVLDGAKDPMNLIIIGHVDSGKSTLAGNMLIHTGMIGEDELR